MCMTFQDDENEWEHEMDTEGVESEADGFHDEWETASESSDVTADIREQLNPLEEVILRSLASLNPSSPNNGNNPGQNPATETPSNDHVIGMNRRTAEFINQLGQNFSPDHSVTAASADSQDAKSPEQENKSGTTDPAGNDNSENSYSRQGEKLFYHIDRLVFFLRDIGSLPSNCFYGNRFTCLGAYFSVLFLKESCGLNLCDKFLII